MDKHTLMHGRILIPKRAIALRASSRGTTMRPRKKRMEEKKKEVQVEGSGLITQVILARFGVLKKSAMDPRLFCPCLAH